MEAYSFYPSERSAATLGEFMEACLAEPQLAAEHFRQGYFEPWLSDVGRRDLAEVAARIRMTGVTPAAGLRPFVEAAFATRSQNRVGGVARPRGTNSRAATLQSGQHPSR